MLAALRLSTPYRLPICRAMPPTVRMATVLLAVQMSTRLTRKAMVSSAPLLLLTWRVMMRMR